MTVVTDDSLLEQATVKSVDAQSWLSAQLSTDSGVEKSTVQIACGLHCLRRGPTASTGVGVVGLGVVWCWSVVCVLRY